MKKFLVIVLGLLTLVSCGTRNKNSVNSVNYNEDLVKYLEDELDDVKVRLAACYTCLAKEYRKSRIDYDEIEDLRYYCDIYKQKEKNLTIEILKTGCPQSRLDTDLSFVNSLLSKAKNEYYTIIHETLNRK